MLDAVARLALVLPETSEVPTKQGLRQWRVKDKLLAWERPLRPADLQALGVALFGVVDRQLDIWWGWPLLVLAAVSLGCLGVLRSPRPQPSRRFPPAPSHRKRNASP